MKSRKIMALLCCTVLAAGLTGCGGSGTSSQVTSAAGQEAAGTSETAGQKSEGAEASSDAASQDDKTFNIDLATAYASDGPAGMALLQFVADVAEQSGGTINISLFADGTLGSASDN